MKPPCVVVVKYLLPAIRALVMKELVEKHGMRKIDVSEKMELTPAAITQYIKGERGSFAVNQLTRSEKTMEMISKLAENIARADVPTEKVMEELCEICMAIRSEGMICDLHSKDLPTLKEREGKCATCQPHD
ncbi:MAG: transcriptional regulator [Candidatus Bathyarchaeia archaeon]